MYRTAVNSNTDIVANTVVNTYAFGDAKDLCSELMFEIASRGNGVFIYVPDSSFLGTVFIHTIANLRAVVGVVPDKGIHSVLHDQIRCGMADVEFSQYPVVPGMLNEEYGDMYRPAKSLTGTIPGSVTIDTITRAIFEDRKGGSERTVNSIVSSLSCRSKSSSASVVVAEAVLRSIHTQKVCDCILRCMYAGSEGGVRAGMAPSEKRFYSLLASSKANLDVIPHMSFDIEHQVGPAFEESSFRHWGKHFLLSFVSAHIHQQCNNFRHKSAQGYLTPFIQSKHDEYQGVVDRIQSPYYHGRR